MQNYFRIKNIFYRNSYLNKHHIKTRNTIFFHIFQWFSHKCQEFCVNTLWREVFTKLKRFAQYILNKQKTNHTSQQMSLFSSGTSIFYKRYSQVKIIPELFAKNMIVFVLFLKRR